MVPSFAELAAAPDPRLDLIALALAQEFHSVDAAEALATLDLLGAEVLHAAEQTSRTPADEVRVCSEVLGVAYGFAGDQDEYDNPDNSMLDLVLTRRRGLPILLSIVYVEAARRAGITLAGIGLPGHFGAAHVGTDPPLLLDPFNGGMQISADVPGALVRPWGAREIAMRMLNNLVGSYARRGAVAEAIRAATMRMALPAGSDERATLQAELRAMQARLN